MTHRPPWVPDDIEDEYLPHYLESAGAVLDRARWAAREYDEPGLLAAVDQIDARNAEQLDNVTRRTWHT